MPPLPIVGFLPWATWRDIMYFSFISHSSIQFRAPHPQHIIICRTSFHCHLIVLFSFCFLSFNFINFWVSVPWSFFARWLYLYFLYCNTNKISYSPNFLFYQYSFVFRKRFYYFYGNLKKLEILVGISKSSKNTYVHMYIHMC